MKKTIQLKGTGIDQASARLQAYNALKKMHKNNVLVYGILSTELIVEPKRATQCNTVNNPPSGARKWSTMYKIMGRNPATNETKQLGNYYAGKTEALKAAKELSLKHHIVCEIHVEKKDESVGVAGLSAQTTAIVSPKMTLGEWLFHFNVEVAD